MNARHDSGRGVAQQGVDDPARLQISALMDGELDDAGVQRAIDAMLASNELVQFWADAHRAGDWLRSDEVIGVGDGEQFMRRFSAQLADEPTILAPKVSKAPRAHGFWMRTGLPGASVAAALAAVVWVALPSAHDGQAEVARASTSDAVAPVVAIAQVAEPAMRAVDPDRLADYFAAHRDMTPFAYRGASARPAAYSPSAGRTGAASQ